MKFDQQRLAHLDRLGISQGNRRAGDGNQTQRQQAYAEGVPPVVSADDCPRDPALQRTHGAPVGTREINEAAHGFPP